MNLPELCIRRPVMTTLLMAAFIIFGIISYRVARLRTAERRFSDDLGQRQPAGCVAGDDGRCGRDAARRAVLDDRRSRLDEFDECAGDDVDHIAVFAGPEH